MKVLSSLLPALIEAPYTKQCLEKVIHYNEALDLIRWLIFREPGIFLMLKTEEFPKPYLGPAHLTMNT